MEDSYDDLMRSHLAEVSDFVPENSSSLKMSKDDAIDQLAIISIAHQQMLAALQDQLMAFIHAQSHGFFECLIIDVLLALGYAGRKRDLAQHLGRSGDGGVDGMISLDELGLDAIYFQAKRLKPSSSVSASAVRDFIGSLETHKAHKGVFVTTGYFTSRAREAVHLAQKRVVFIDGATLTKLMVRHSIGAKAVATYQFKEIDMGYFHNAPSHPARPAKMRTERAFT